MRPLLEKRQQAHGGLANLFLMLLSIGLALVLGAGMVALTGVNPLTAYGALFHGAFGRTYGLADIVVKGTPLALSGLGSAIAFRANVWNIGADGQIYMGAVGAALVGLNIGGLPTWLHLPLVLLAGAVGGGLWALGPGLLRAYLKVNEVIVTLMLNYVAALFVGWLVHGPMAEVNGFMPQSARLPVTAQLPLLLPPTRIHAGVFVALLAALAIQVLLFRTSVGYRIRAIGANPHASRYGGIGVERYIILVMVLSGMLSGLAGAVEVSGVHQRLLEGISPGYGYAGIVVALLGKLNPVGVLCAAYLFASLSVGADMMQKTVRVPTALSQIIQGLVVLCILGTEILLQYTIVPLRRFQRRKAGGVSSDLTKESHG
jgi:general nucleoside transport system permease protein